MKHRFGFVIAVGVGLFGQASALAQQPAPAPSAAPPAALPSDKPPTEPAAPPSDKPTDTPPVPAGDSVAGQTDPNAQPAPKAPEPTPNAPPAPPPAGASTTGPVVPPPVTLPPYLTGGPAPITVFPPVPPPVTTAPPPPPGPGADAGVTPKKKPAYLRWRGSGINWNHGVSATALGVGNDYNSGDDQQYVQSLSATFNYFLIEPKDEQGNKRGYQLRVQSSLGFDVELTNSDSTKEKYEKQLRDIPISFVMTKTMWKGEGDAAVLLNLNATGILPTSLVSRSQGIYFSANPRAALFFNVPLRGKDAPFLQSVFLGVGSAYTHRFSAAETPTNSDLRRLRQTTTGSLLVSDQLTGRSLDSNNLRGSAFAFFSEKLFGGDLWASVGVGATYQFVNNFESPSNGCDVVIMTGCTTAQRLDNPLDARVVADFGVSFSYFPNADWGVSVGYDNVAGQLGPDGKWRNPFHSPNAQFSASLVVSVDSLVERLQGSIRAEPVIFFGSNKKVPTLQQARQTEMLF
jgi:hypothetical protein